jgi:hypothetical protein
LAFLIFECSYIFVETYERNVLVYKRRRETVIVEFPIGVLVVNENSRTRTQSGENEYHVKIAKTPEEIKSLLEVGFKYVCEKDDLIFFRKRK